jgi:hypothetical protein
MDAAAPDDEPAPAGEGSATRYGAFRRFLRSPDDPRIAGIGRMDAYSWAGRMLEHPRAGPLFAAWRKRYEESEFDGITADGTVRPGLFEEGPPEGAPTAEVAAATSRVLRLASAGQRAVLCHPLRARERRAWMNPEVYMLRFGLRLEEVEPPLRDAILAVLRASLSEAGFDRCRTLMRLNGFLGELVGGSRVMNEFSYNFNLFGSPGLEQPWGWSFYGHHLCLNAFFAGERMVLTPAFMGAEPDHIDSGPHAGAQAFGAEERLALALVRALPPEMQRAARLYERKRDPAMPPGRIALGDELMLAGAFQDNRVIPYEGAPVRAFGAAQRGALLDLVSSHLCFLPRGPLEARLRECERRLDETWFCWIGGIDDADPFYYRIQSPVLLIEFDHHAGVFLGNPEPERFHVHTIVRTPNGGDYGMAAIRCCCARRPAVGGVSP